MNIIFNFINIKDSDSLKRKSKNIIILTKSSGDF